MSESRGRCGIRIRALLGLLPLVPPSSFGQAPQDRPPGAAAHHIAVDPGTFPWSSVVKLFNSVGGACTGAVVARDKVVTAAHCLYGFRTRRFLPADAIHVLIGYGRGDYRVHARVSRYATGPGYDPGNEATTFAADWAILTLAQPLPAEVRPLPLAADMPSKGTKVMLGGFAQDRAYAMTADTDCAVLGANAASPLVFHDCASFHGDSGAPLLDADPARGFAILGIVVGIGTLSGSPVGIATRAAGAAVLGPDAPSPALTPPP